MWAGSVRLKGSSCRPRAIQHSSLIAFSQNKSSIVSPPPIQNLDDILSSSEGDDAAAQKRVMACVQSMMDESHIQFFGKGRQVPKRQYQLSDLRLNSIQAEKLLSPSGETTEKVAMQLQIAYVALLGTVAVQTGFEQASVLAFGTLFGLTVDQIALMGGGRFLVLDSVAGILRPSYRKRVAVHEAGHFMVAYLAGLMPLAYTLSSFDAYRQYRALNVQAGCRFADAEFSAEVASGKVTSGSLERFCVVALAGLCSEYVKYGSCEGGLADIQQLDGMLKALQFSQAKADGEVRWAVLTNVLLLRRHSAILDDLADAMLQNKSVGQCIGLLEARLADSDDV